MIAYFDHNGRCREIHTGDGVVENEWPHAAIVLDGTSPTDVWYDIEAEEVCLCNEVDPAEALNLPAIIPTGQPFTIQVPAGCVLIIRGEEFTNEAVIDTSKPRRILVEVNGRLHGRHFMHINSYAENRANEYPPIADQLDALWKGGSEEAAMRQKVMAVKSKHPKPTA